jgi:hypothetical protein
MRALAGKPVSRSAAAAIGVVLACAGCGLRDPTLNQGRSTATSTASAPAAATTAATTTSTAVTTTQPATGDTDPANMSGTPAPAPPGAPGSARNVIYRFALAYSNVSAATIGSQVRTMISLATPAYGASLKASAAQAQLAVGRGLPQGGQMTAQVLGIQLSPAQGGFEHATVTMQIALTLASGNGEPPFTSTFSADVLRSGGAWRVADFEGQQ